MKLFSLISLIIFVVIVVTSNDGGHAIENVDIDLLVQNYLYIERELWRQIYGSSAKRTQIIENIRKDHTEFLTRRSLDDAMSGKSKFARFLNFTELDNYAKESPMLIALADQATGTISTQFISTSREVISNFNRIVSEDLFHVIKEVSTNIDSKIVYKSYSSKNLLYCE